MLALLGLLLLVQDTVVGPYVTPDRLPPSATPEIQLFGDTLFREEGTNWLYVIHLSSGAKVYHPILYDTDHPFEVMWAKGGLQFRNARAVHVRVRTPAPMKPTIHQGRLEYISVHGSQSNTAVGFYSRGASPTDPGWEHMNQWPLPQRILDHFTRNGVNDLNTLQFYSTVSSREWTPGENVNGFPLMPVLEMGLNNSFTDLTTVEVIYTPLSHPQSNTSKVNRFAWKGPYDVNIDGELDYRDLQSYDALYNQNDPRADLNRDGRVGTDDRQQILSMILQSNPPSSSSGDGSGIGADDGGLQKATGGCGLASPARENLTQAVLACVLAFFAFLIVVRSNHSTKRKK